MSEVEVENIPRENSPTIMPGKWSTTVAHFLADYSRVDLLRLLSIWQVSQLIILTSIVFKLIFR